MPREYDPIPMSGELPTRCPACGAHSVEGSDKAGNQKGLYACGGTFHQNGDQMVGNCPQSEAV